jgi:hypothetical protein
LENISDDKLKTKIKEFYLDILDRIPDKSGLDYYFTEIKQGKISLNDLKYLFKNSPEYYILHDKLQIVKNEPDSVFISHFNNGNESGGISVISDDLLTTIYEGVGCYGLYFDNVSNVLLCVTRTDPQILAFKISDKKFSQIPIEFKNYVFGFDAHGIYLKNSKLFLCASDGDKKQLAKNKDGPGDFVGKIIVSDIEINSNKILIQNSKLYNPFDCDHHHHINDIFSIDDELYFSSFSYCQEEKYFPSGCISKFNFNHVSEILINDLFHPHSLISYENKFYFCSSSASQILSYDVKTNNLHLEYKGPNTFIRGLLPTSTFLYFGLSNTLGRTNSKFNNVLCCILKFNKLTGETTKFDVPIYSNNVYSIISNQ